MNSIAVQVISYPVLSLPVTAALIPFNPMKYLRYLFFAVLSALSWTASAQLQVQYLTLDETIEIANSHPMRLQPSIATAAVTGNTGTTRQDFCPHSHSTVHCPA